MSTTSKKHIIDFAREGSDDLYGMMLRLQLSPIRKNSKYPAMREIFLFVDEVFEDIECSSGHDSALDEGKLHKISEKLKVKSE